MAMARDGLLPPWFARLNPQSWVPQNATVVTGLFAASLAFTMNIQQLSAMVCHATHHSFAGLCSSFLGSVPPKKNLSLPCTKFRVPRVPEPAAVPSLNAFCPTSLLQILLCFLVRSWELCCADVLLWCFR